MTTKRFLTLAAAALAATLCLTPAAQAGPRLDKIMESKVLRVGTPGDYRPFAIKTDAGYSGHDIDVIELVARELGVKIEYVPTSWPNLMKDIQANKFDVAVGGITRNVTRIRQIEMLPGYAPFGKVALVRAADKAKFSKPDDLNQASGAVDVEDHKAGPPVGPAMIQPYMAAIASEGEWSLIFFVGELSHAVLKTPKPGDFRSQPDYDAHLRVLRPPPEALALAQAAVDFIGRDRLLYARVDMVRAEDGGFCLMELELIEPDLYLSYDPEAVMHFKDAVDLAMQVCGCAHDHVH